MFYNKNTKINSAAHTYLLLNPFILVNLLLKPRVLRICFTQVRPAEPAHCYLPVKGQHSEVIATMQHMLPKRQARDALQIPWLLPHHSA